MDYPTKSRAVMVLETPSRRRSAISAIMDLPSRLTTDQMKRLEDYALMEVPKSSPCPPERFAEEFQRMKRNLSMRRMDADIGRDLVTDYAKSLGRFSEEAITHLADWSIENLKWFPPIPDCLSILESHQREDLKLIRLAKAKLRKERHARLDDAQMGIRFGRIGQDEANQLPKWIKAALIKSGELMEDGTIHPSAVWVREGGYADS